MKFLATALAAVLGAEAVLAGPVNLVPREPRMTKRRALRKTSPRIAAEGEEMVALSSNGSQVSYSSNWAGAVLIGSGYQSVVGTITVPTPKAPSGGSSRTQYAASAWVGIDGDTCQTSM